MSAVVFDASVLVKLVAEEPGTDAAARAYKAADTVIAPSWARIECAQALWKKVRRGEWDSGQALRALAALDRAEMRIIDANSLTPAALSLACHVNHSVYDCVYLALAVENDATLVTADRRLFAIATTVIGERAVLITG
ncbi:MAG: type II toxin-antitoxin system VapC family toxin [Coriobacteriia bacterium]|nr:type II toxin-antitoxin system VapC family toxin [Coriobacteriia bacterium]